MNPVEPNNLSCGSRSSFGRLSSSEYPDSSSYEGASVILSSARSSFSSLIGEFGNSSPDSSVLGQDSDTSEVNNRRSVRELYGAIFAPRSEQDIELEQLQLGFGWLDNYSRELETAFNTNVAHRLQALNEEQQEDELNIGIAELIGEVGQFFQALERDFGEITEAFDRITEARVVERPNLANIGVNLGNVRRDLAHIIDDLGNMNRILGELDQDLDLYDESMGDESEPPPKRARHS
jgi:hypothetical protein